MRKNLLAAQSILIVLAAVFVSDFALYRQVAADDATPAAPAVHEQTLAGDTDCDGLITGLDALAILRFVASSDVADCLRISGNVLCNDRLDAADAIAVLHYAGGFTIELGPGCPMLGQSVFTPPEVSLNCDAGAINANDDLRCHYSAESYYGDVTLTWDLADGQEPALDPAALGASCAPDGVPCWYSAWGPKTVEFEHPGPKVISLTACANDKCVTKIWRLTVETAALATN